ncbi:MAG TPA: hypothetical protein VMT61_08630 [Candidatus Binataceae bacterium]|nr:hypothetical protein [Candidatus Binataceae bacterium]
MIAQHRKPQEPALADSIFHDIQKTVQEDIAVFEAHQQLLNLKPNGPLVSIKSDAALIAARRIIDRLLEAERNA